MKQKLNRKYGTINRIHVKGSRFVNLALGRDYALSSNFNQKILPCEFEGNCGDNYRKDNVSILREEGHGGKHRRHCKAIDIDDRSDICADNLKRDLSSYLKNELNDSHCHQFMHLQLYFRGISPDEHLGR